MFSGWRIPIRNRIAQVQAELRVVGTTPAESTGPARETIAAAEDAVADAEAAVGPLSRWAAFANLLTGEEIERAWADVHRADELLLRIAGREVLEAKLPKLEADARSRLPAADPWFAVLAAWPFHGQASAKPRGDASPQLVARQFSELRAELNSRSEKAHSSVRTFRNVVLIAIVIVTIGLVVAALDPPDAPWLPICGSGGDCPAVWQVIVAGALGGLLTGLAALRGLRGLSVTYALPYWLALLKVPAGGLTGLLGIVWMQSGVIGGLEMQTTPHVIAYAALFGAAQEAVTSFADTQGGKLLGSAKGAGQP